MGHDWKRWFEGYAADWASGEVEAVAARYAPSFLVSKPGKSAFYSNDRSLVAWLERVRDFHVRSGLERVEIVTVREVPLGEYHALVSVLWAVRFQKTQLLRIQFEISYTMSTRSLDTDGPLILSILSHEDQREAMRRYGIL
jgi:hypothetical protein